MEIQKKKTDKNKLEPVIPYAYMAWFLQCNFAAVIVAKTFDNFTKNSYVLIEIKESYTK